MNLESVRLIFAVLTFSEIGIETATVVGKDGERVEEWLELPNGCVCCSVRTDLVMTLESLVSKKRFDYIFIETTGLAGKRITNHTQTTCRSWATGLFTLVG